MRDSLGLVEAALQLDLGRQARFEAIHLEADAVHDVENCRTQLGARGYKERALAVFVKPPSIDELAKRLTARNTDSASSISSRVFKAKFELGFEDQFDKVIVNDDLSRACAEAEKLVQEFLKSEPAIV